jgi:putative flippase GtrA
MLSSYGLIWTLSGPLGLNVFLAKIITDAILSIVSFFAQREFVYNSSARIKIFKNHQVAASNPGSK